MHRFRFRLACRAVCTLALILTLISFAMPLMQAQTFAVLHSFTGSSDGGGPYAGLTMDRAGNFYGTTNFGGETTCGGGFGCGVVFKLKPVNSAWVLTPIYTFQGYTVGDGQYPEARVLFGPDGALYGTTAVGGTGDSCVQHCGTAYRLTPAATACKSALCPWNETVLHSFMGPATDGAFPGFGDVVFDASGDLYGTTAEGGGGGFMGTCGEYGCGVAYEISPSNGSWNTSTIYQFVNGPANTPFSGFVRDSSGNLYGTTVEGGAAGDGVIYELTAAGGSWSQTILYNFLGQEDGRSPEAGLVADSFGNFYGATQYSTGGGGTLFELSPTNDGWNYSVLYTFDGYGPLIGLTLDAAGNLYGTTWNGGLYGDGNVFKLTHSNGSWTYTSLHDFTGGNDGAKPISNVILDASGNLYGTASQGGSGSMGGCDGHGCGVVWEITP